MLRDYTLPNTVITPRVATILVTYKCTAACKNCCFNSNPFIQKRLTVQEIFDFIEDLSRLKTIEVIVFSGGECFLLENDLVSTVKLARSHGFKVRCVTNGYWAKSLTAGKKRLLELKQAGLNEINFSTGDYHQEWVSEKTLINGILLSLDIGFDNIALMVETQKERKVTSATILSNKRFNDIDLTRLKILESPWMPMSLEDTISQKEEHMVNKTNVHLRRGCDSIFTTLVLSPDKELGICCGLARENISHLNSRWENGFLDVELLKHTNDFLKIWLFVDGPEKIISWVASKDPNILWENLYSHHCHACLALFKREEIRNVIRKHYRERLDDVLFRYSLILRQQEMRF